MSLFLKKRKSLMIHVTLIPRWHLESRSRNDQKLLSAEDRFFFFSWLSINILWPFRSILDKHERPISSSFWTLVGRNMVLQRCHCLNFPFGRGGLIVWNIGSTRFCHNPLWELSPPPLKCIENFKCSWRSTLMVHSTGWCYHHTHIGGGRMLSRCRDVVSSAITWSESASGTGRET